MPTDVLVKHAVVSPPGMIHAVRHGAMRTACGQDHRRKRFARGYSNRGWTMMKTSFDELNVRRAGSMICKNCLENLAAGTGPA